MAGLTVFIDEAGDEGYNIVRPPEKKASEWFLLGAVVCRTDNLHLIERGVPEPFHFRKEYHHKCVQFAETIAALPITAMVVVAHKPSMPQQAAVRAQKHYLFNYCAKLLLERVSWFCAANSKEPANIVFSQRRKLSIKLLREYLAHLRDAPRVTIGGQPIFDNKTSINWGAIDPERVDMQPADSLPGLSVADGIVSGFAKAIEWSPSYNTEHRYLKIMQNKFYRYGWLNKCERYGVKFIPDNAPLKDDIWERERFHWLRHFK